MRAVGALLFAGSFLVYLAVSRLESVAYDAASMIGVAHQMVNHFSLNASGGFDDYLRLSTPYSPYGIGTSLLIVPFYAVSKVTGHEQAVLALINPAVTSTTVVVAYAIGRRLRWSEALAVVAAATFAVCTMALQATTELFSEPSVSLCVALVIWGALRWRDGIPSGALLVGIAAAAAAQFRSDSVVTVWIGLLALPLIVSWSEVRRPRRMAAVGVPLVLSLVGIGAYNDLRWHSVLKFSYNGQGFHTPLFHGLDGLLLSPGKGFFLYNPIAVLGVVGIVLLLRTNRGVGVLFLLLIVPRIIFFARWDAWEGGVDWGPRFLLPVVLLFVLGAVEVLHRTTARSLSGTAARAGFVLLALAGLAVGYLSVRVPYEQWYGTLAAPASAARYAHGHPFFVGQGGTAVGDAYDFTFRASQIRGDLDLLVQGGAEMAPAAFREGHATTGWLLLGSGVAGLAGACVVAVGIDRTRRRRGDVDDAPLNPSGPGRGPTVPTAA